jgi:uncharacterized protein YukE
MKEKVLKIVRQRLGVAEDDLYRAKLQLNKMNTENMQKEWGQSGMTFEDLFKRYQSSVDELKRCVDWVEIQR